MADGEAPEPFVTAPASPGEEGAPAPLPVLPLEYAPPAAAPWRGWRRIAHVCLAAGWLACVVALLLIPGRTESVLVTGPVLFALGVLTLLGSLFTRDPLAAFVGASHCAVCVLFLFLVNAFRWSPQQARTPFLVMGTVYTLAVSVPTALVFLRQRGALKAQTHDVQRSERS